MRTRINMEPGRRKMIAAVKAEYRRMHRVLEPRMAHLADPEQRNVNVAQNVLRDCITVVLHEMLPYSHRTPIELADRLASYALSVVPIEDQDAVVAEHLNRFADFHLERTAQGMIIDAGWRMADGSERPNFPEGSAG